MGIVAPVLFIVFPLDDDVLLGSLFFLFYELCDRKGSLLYDVCFDKFVRQVYMGNVNCVVSILAV